MPTLKRPQRESLVKAEQRLNNLARRGLDALFELAQVLSKSQLIRAIKLVSSVDKYSDRDELLEYLNKCLARRVKHPATLEQDIRLSLSHPRGPERTLTQLVAVLSPNRRAILLNQTLARLEMQTKGVKKSRAIPRAMKPARPILDTRRRYKLAKGGGRFGGRRMARKSAPKKGSGGGGARPETHGSGGGSGNGSPRLRPNGPYNVGPPSEPPSPGPPSPPSAAVELGVNVTPSRPPKRIVSSGFAQPSQAAKPIKSDTPLKAGEKYYFWLEVGERVSGTIEVKDEPLPTEKLPSQALLDVVLFEVKDGLRLIPGQDIGRLKLEEGAVTVESQPTKTPPPSISVESPLLKRRLFFPVIAPEESGDFRMRCNIYYRTVLVQSRTVNAYVMRRPQTRKKALQAKVDYTLSRSLSADHVRGIRPHLLSVMINSNGNGTHDFFFYGDEKFQKDNISFNGEELQGLIEQARNAYALAAWGSNNPWANQNYRYDQSRVQNLQQLKDDLVRCAIRGYNIYDMVINRLAGGAAKVDDLEKLMTKPGMVQIALKESPSFILPAAIIYDYPLDVDADSTKFTLCPAFLKALDAAPPLEEAECFKGNCPSKNNDTVVCPSGFWGYRHQLGLPLSVAGAPDAPTTINWSNKPIMTVGVSTDPKFILRDKHLQNLQAIRAAGLEWNLGSTRDDVIKKLKETRPQLVYFYCHGGLSGTRPYLQVGSGANGNLSPSFLRAKKIRWDTPRPLVFINGCNTTALEPEQAIEFITPFIENANAAGVIGTEITIFEPIATVFGEECLRRFLNKSPIGEAVRGARLKLLKNANPLGLVYIPYVMASLSLVEQ
jgi:hypothetical protein